MKNTIISSRSKKPWLSREEEWEEFSEAVGRHIVDYTIPQYGDAPDDQLAVEWDVSDCMKAIKKYANRVGTNARGEAETLRDMLKVAHYACVAYFKIKGDRNGN